MRDLRLLVRAYRINDAPRLEAQLRHFAGMELGDAIRNAALALKPNGKRHSHQRRIPQTSLDAAALALGAARQQVEGCRTFEELYDLVRRVTGNIPRFGDLTCYDSALRIGAQIGRLPKLVFLQRGAKKGFEALGLHTNERAVGLKVFQDFAPLKKLKPHEVEDFLCIYKDELPP